MTDAEVWSTEIKFAESKFREAISSLYIELSAIPYISALRITYRSLPTDSRVLVEFIMLGQHVSLQITNHWLLFIEPSKRTYCIVDRALRTIPEKDNTQVEPTKFIIEPIKLLEGRRV